MRITISKRIKNRYRSKYLYTYAHSSITHRSQKMETVQISINRWKDKPIVVHRFNGLWEIPQELGISDHLTCLLRNLYADQEAIVRTRHGTMDWFKTGKGVCQSCILSLCLFNLYAEYIKRNARLMKHKLESRLPGEISGTSDMQMTPP